MKNTKRALLTSLLSLLLCCSMLIGTTFAWFTDEVKSANNIITAGNLDVELDYWDGDSWETVQSTDKLFSGQLWEPGHTEVVYLKLSNAGTLALKYQLGINIVSETAGTNVAGDTFKLSDYIYMGVVEGIEPKFDSRELAISEAQKPDADKGIISNGYTKSGKMNANQADLYLAVVVYMPTSVGNVANYKTGTAAPTINLGINLFATQQMAEDDSFGPDYDEDAWNDGMQVYNAQDLQTALNNGETNIVLMDDIVAEEPIVIPAAPVTYSLRSNPAVIIDLNGKTITTAYNEETQKHKYAIDNYGNLIIKGGIIEARGIYNREGATMTVNGTKIVNLDTNGGSCIWSYGGSVILNDATLIGYTGCVYSDGYLEINGGTYTCYAAILDDGTQLTPTYNIRSNGQLVINDGDFTSRHGLVAVKDSAVINGGTYTMTSIGVITSHVIYVWGTDAKVTVNGGTFNCDLRTAQANGSSMIYMNATGATASVYGGTFNLTPEKYVAEGYKAVQSNGKYVVVSGTIADENVVATPDELKVALSGAADAGSGDNTIYLTGDIDLTGTTWTSISVDGYNGAGIITIEGNGATIKGLTAPLFAGGFAGKSGIVIKNLTIADSNIVSTSGLGGGAFIDTADSMQIITLENCHVVNSTVTGERTGGLIGWCSGYAKLNDGPVKTYVTISNCSVVDSTVIGAGSAGAIAGHPGASDYTYTTIENCVVKNVNVVSNDDGSWRTGAIVGTANNGHVVINNVTVEDVTLTQDGVTAGDTLLYGRFVPSGTGTLVIDGASVLSAATTEALKAAIEAGQEEIYLPAGNYTLPSVNNGDVTISGTKDTVITVNKPNYTGSDVTFNGVTIKGSGYATGVQHVNTVTYNDATIIGEMCLYGEKVVFNSCTFELNGQYIWTYGAKEVEFINCTFNTTGKAILIYNEGAGASKVTVKGCTFNATAGAKAGAIANQNCAAIEIDNHQNSGTGTAHVLVTEGNTYSDFFSGEWRIKNFVSGNAVTVNGVEYTSIAIDGKTMTIDANKNVTVNP